MTALMLMLMMPIGAHIVSGEVELQKNIALHTYLANAKNYYGNDAMREGLQTTATIVKRMLMPMKFFRL